MNNKLNNPYELKITVKHTGKMEGFLSLSTSVLLNTQCQKNCKVPGSICEKCYAVRQVNRCKKNFPEALEHNFNVLTRSIIPNRYLPILNCKYFRFEAFGDLENETQFINYLHICNKNKRVKFAIWSKNPHIMESVFNEMGYKKPKNLVIIISSLFINKAWNYESLPYSKKYWFIDKIFTVYTKKYADENGIVFNCIDKDIKKDKKCLDCLLCYTKNNIKYINEKLK